MLLTLIQRESLAQKSIPPQVAQTSSTLVPVVNSSSSVNKVPRICHVLLSFEPCFLSGDNDSDSNCEETEEAQIGVFSWFVSLLGFMSGHWPRQMYWLSESCSVYFGRFDTPPCITTLNPVFSMSSLLKFTTLAEERHRPQVIRAMNIQNWYTLTLRY